ncbi:hypothetical protein NFI96_022992 [Prochilodus magdalenae]|nr:hypothetical protein NFI96_022992 [Prochilodus magdalenae]
MKDEPCLQPSVGVQDQWPLSCATFPLSSMSALSLHRLITKQNSSQNTDLWAVTRCHALSEIDLEIGLKPARENSAEDSIPAKPISLVERCWCRSTVNTVPQRNIRELKFVHTPNCSFQVIAKLKNNKEVCINPETKWLQQYLKNALEKMKKAKEQTY